MSRVTKLFCDLCGEESSISDIFFFERKEGTIANTTRDDAGFDICITCARKIGGLVAEKPKK